MEGRYPPGMFIVLADCRDPSREDAWNRWYADTFIRGLEELAYVKNSRRYVNAFAEEATFRGRPKYLSLHEVYHDNLPVILRELHKREAELISNSSAAQPMLIKLSTLYRRAGPEFRSGRKDPIQVVYCGLVGMMDRSRSAEFDKWYNERHSPDALNAGIFDIGYRYDVVNLHDPLPHLSSPCLSLYESSVSLPELQKKLESFRKTMIDVDPIWVDLLGIWYSGLFRPMK